MVLGVDRGESGLARLHRLWRSVKKLWRVEVKWLDSQLHLGGWESVASHRKRRKRVICYSVGFVLADDKKGIILASSVNGANATGVVSIPSRQIVKRRRLR